MSHSYYKGKLVIEDTHWTRFRNHRDRWKSCKACPLHKTRKRVVLIRGAIPADVLFIGEAPGEAEDSIGLPFVGPAGHLFNKLIKEAFARLGHEWDGKPTYPFSFAIGNILGCYPKEKPQADQGISSGKIRQPSREEALSCRPRLEELFGLIGPKRVVTLGKTAEKYLHLIHPQPIPMIHPSAILRQSEHKQSLTFKRTVLQMAEIFKGLVPDDPPWEAYDY